MTQDFRQPPSYHEPMNHPFPQDPSAKNFTFATYVVFLVSMFFSAGLASFVGLIMAYAKRSDMAGTVYESHMTYMIRTFWFGLLGTILGWLTVIFLVGFLILFAVWAWSVYRFVFGLIRLNDNRAVDPYRWFEI